VALGKMIHVLAQIWCMQ